MRKTIRLSCMLHTFAGDTWYGHTRDLSFDGALIECPGAALAGRKTFKAGDMAVLVVSTRKEDRQELLVIGCRAVHVCGSAIGLSLFVSTLAASQLSQLKRLLDG